MGGTASTNPTKRPKPLPAREAEEKLEDKPSRLTALNNYLENHWDPWAKQVLPLFKANELYDQLFSLHQRLSVEGDRIEILWGHLFLAWNYSAGIKIHHPLLLTPLDLEFNPDRRKITLRPAQSRTTQFDLECLRDLDYPNKDKLLKYVARINGGDAPPDVWNHDSDARHRDDRDGFIEHGARGRNESLQECADRAAAGVSHPRYL